MAAPVSPLSITGPIQSPRLASPGPGAPRGAFQAVLADAVSRVENFRLDAQTRVDSFLAGEEQELHQVIVDVQRAELAFEMFLQVRNKVVQAYQEIMRIQM
jgi:flagellar hook-basal body complex protein FliE